ncbi:hypothetical protein CRUP_014383, partial [Coryphaenoides rupestris]
MVLWARGSSCTVLHHLQRQRRRPDGTHVSNAVSATEGADTMPNVRSQSEPPRDKRRPVSLHEQNGKPSVGRGGRRPTGKLPGQSSLEDCPAHRTGERGSGGGGDRWCADSRRLEKIHSQDYEEGKEDVDREKRERQRREEEEFQARYRSDPNLARYPVKPQKEEQEMRMHAKVSKVRHERRHSDLAINEVGLGPGDGGGGGGGGGEEEGAVMVTRGRPYKSKRGGNKRQMSISSSEEEGGSTPEYTSCEDVDMESVSEK